MGQTLIYTLQAAMVHRTDSMPRISHYSRRIYTYIRSSEACNIRVGLDRSVQFDFLVRWRCHLDTVAFTSGIACRGVLDSEAKPLGSEDGVLLEWQGEEICDEKKGKRLKEKKGLYLQAWVRVNDGVESKRP